MSNQNKPNDKKRKQSDMETEDTNNHNTDQKQRLDMDIKEESRVTRRPTWEQDYPSRYHQWVIFIPKPTERVINDLGELIREALEVVETRLDGIQWHILRTIMDLPVTEESMMELMPSSRIIVTQLTIPYTMMMGESNMIDMLANTLLTNTQDTGLPQGEEWHNEAPEDGDYEQDYGEEEEEDVDAEEDTFV